MCLLKGNRIIYLVAPGNQDLACSEMALRMVPFDSKWIFKGKIVLLSKLFIADR